MFLLFLLWKDFTLHFYGFHVDWDFTMLIYLLGPVWHFCLWYRFDWFSYFEKWTIVWSHFPTSGIAKGREWSWILTSKIWHCISYGTGITNFLGKIRFTSPALRLCLLKKRKLKQKGKLPFLFKNRIVSNRFKETCLNILQIITVWRPLCSSE